MTATEMVRNSLTSAGKTQKELAAYMNWTPQNLSGRLKNDTLTFDELSKALSFAGFTVKMVDSKGEHLPDLDNSSSPRVSQMVAGKVYDTSKAESLCDSKEKPSDKLYIELFKDPAGEYFLTYYQCWEGGVSTIRPINNDVAQEFWERYSGKPSETMA